MNYIHYNSCPACDSPAIDPLFGLKDHSVSGEEFVIWNCSECGLRFTQDVPDAGSIGKYYQSEDYISHTNTSSGLINSLYQRVRKHTLKQKAKLIESVTKKRGHLLDLGAGTGAFAAFMRSRAWKVTAIEPDEGARKEAKRSFSIELEPADRLLELAPGSFDAITLWHVLEHVHDLHGYLDHLRLLLANDGKIFIAVPNFDSADAQHYGPFWAAYDVPRHLYHFSYPAIRQLAKRHGFQLVEAKPMWFDSFYIAMLSSKYHKGKTSLIGAAFQGMRSNINALFNRKKASSLIYILNKTTGQT